MHHCSAAEIWRFFRFFKMAAVRYLGFLVHVFGPPTKGIWCLYQCAKFGWNGCNSSHNMHVFRFCEFGLITPIHTPKIGCFGIFNP